ncbi:MAG: M3 family oligoendopeptidase [Anaerolineae bacterium]|nr:M3 family oligoendopeptidase [Anaerolineae bacterium]
MSAETFELARWSLADLLPATHGPEFDSVVGEMEGAVAELESQRDRLSPDMPTDQFQAMMDLVVKIAVIGGRLRAYSYLWFTEDTQEQEALAFRGRVEKLLTDVENRTLFFSLWWKGLDDEPAARLLAASGDNAYYLESLRRFKPHTLSEPEERIINVKDVNGTHGLVTIYEMVTNAFTFEVEIDGELKKLNRAELSVYARDPRPEVREAIYRELYRVYAQDGTVLGQIYQYLVRDWSSENLDLRHFSSPIAVRNLANDIPDTVVDTLLEACRANASLFQRYFRLKAGWLGMDRLRRYDIYAPLTASEKTFDFDEAAKMVLASLEDFSPVLAGHARRVFADGHLDSELRPRKDTGAFCYSVLPGLTPWVLINYTGQVSDVAALAHELGHAIHGLMAAEHTPLTFHSSLPLAETASVFSEMLLLERLLAQEKDPALRRDVLARFVDDTYATVTRQAYFVLFERDAHRLIAEGRTTEQLSAHYLDNLQEQFGDSVELSDEFRWEWTSIPHIYRTPFYCYAYSFGQLLVLALYGRYRKEGKPFVARYEKILAYGGSRSPAEILTEAGIDMTSLEFWNGGFDIIAEMIDELESLG